MRTSMMKRSLLIGIAAAAVLHAAGDGLWGQEPRRGDLGRKIKLRILVDKVMQPQEGWVTKEWIVRETAKAGFNVFSPRRGHERLDEVRRVTEWCGKYGIFHIPWMRGSLAAPKGPKADGKRVLLADGTEQPLWSACSDEFWDWTTRHVVAYAKIAAKTDRLIGVFLDYEDYWKGGHGNLYQITYEDVILRPFLQGKGVKLPGIPPGQRQAWLKKQALHDEFADFQVAHWRMRCRRLRQEVDKHDPKFRFCVYPAPGTPFIVRACYREWATKDAPIILADASVYGRGSRTLPQADALERNRRKLLAGMKIPRRAGVPFIYSGGIDPVVAGADPEFCGKNAVMISEVTAGYWVFYEGPKYRKDHPDYFRWFTWANERIAGGRFKAWREPRQTPETWMADVFRKAGDLARCTPPAVTGRKTTLPKVLLRGENIVLLGAKKGLPVEITLHDVPVASYTSRLAWEVRGPSRKKVASGLIPHGKQQTVRFTPGGDGTYLLGVSSGSCACRVSEANVPVAVLARPGASFIRGAERLYFHVPPKTAKFTVTAEGRGSETVRVNVFDPEGKQAATGQTTKARRAVAIEVAAGRHAGKTWSLSATKADSGVLEDYVLRLSRGVPPALALAPEHVFTLAE